MRGHPYILFIVACSVLIATACLTDPDAPVVVSDGRLISRPAEPSQSSHPGQYRLDLESGRDGLIYIPSGYQADEPAVLLVLLHGAGGAANNFVPLFNMADSANFIVLVPESRGYTWDLLSGGYGEDVFYIDQALAYTFERCAINTERLALGGFSDGATYALSLGLLNGDLFTHVIAFSPGGASAPDRHGNPGIFVSHGTEDAILDIDATSRTLVPQLEALGYDVTYVEFEGDHEIPASIIEEAFDWLKD